ncbi:hypothetical protein Rs2_36446 [Raphanus sativus]|nr:hypothetical protein Rs2_36446 [Raphanus sativus]
MKKKVMGTSLWRWELSVLMIEKALSAIAIVLSIWLVKSLMVMPLAAWFHLSKYDEKIKDALYYECILEVLSAPPTIEISPYLPQNATLSLMICIQFIYQHGRGRD